MMTQSRKAHAGPRVCVCVCVLVLARVGVGSAAVMGVGSW
jgi:hypothetical protein